MASTTSRRIVILGNSGAGKSTLAQKLSAKYDLRYVDMDGLFWQDNWVMRTRPELDALVTEATAGDNWVTDSNYLNFDRAHWERATHIIWLDYHFPLVFFRILRRTFGRLWTGERLWGTNNYESPWETFFSRKSILIWCIQNHWVLQRRLRKLFEEEKGLQSRLRVFRWPWQLERWIAGGMM